MKSQTVSLRGMTHRVTPSTRRMLANKVNIEGPLLLLLKREPDNEEDENAIKVKLAEPPYKGMQIGYVPRGVAAVWAPEIDKGRMHVVEARLATLEGGSGDGEIVVQYTLGAKTRGNKRKTKGVDKHGKRR